MSGVDLSESTLERTTEDAGRRIAALLAEGFLFGLALLWSWRKDAQGRTVGYLTVDATGTRQQGANGSAAEGRMAYVAGVYNPPPPEWLGPPGPGPPLQARYVSGLYSLAEVGPLLRRQAAGVGLQKAEVWVALTDGGNGLEEFLQRNFNRPDLVVILDFWHAASYLEELARALYPQDEAAAVKQAEEWCSLLKAEGGATTLAVLQNWAWPARQPAALREQREKVSGYFGNNLHRMEYPEYLAEGWQIGSYGSQELTAGLSILTAADRLEEVWLQTDGLPPGDGRFLQGVGVAIHPVGPGVLPQVVPPPLHRVQLR